MQLIDGMIPTRLRRDPASHREARYVVSVGLIYIIFSVPYAFLYEAFGIRQGAVALLVGPAVAIFALGLFRWVKRPIVISSLIVGSHYFMILYLISITGGLKSSVVGWSLITVSAAALLHGLEFGAVWALLKVLAYVALTFGWFGLRTRNLVDPQVEKRFFLLVNQGLPFVGLTLAWAFRLETRRANRSEAAKSVQLQEEQAKSMAAAKMAALGEMAGGISHEINNPLAIICLASGGLLKMVREDRFDPKRAKELLEINLSTAARISGIVRGLLEFCREGNGEELQPESCQQIFEETFVFCRERFKTHGVALKTSFLDGDAQILCHRVQIAQVLLNLLNNAFYANRDRPHREIELTLQKKEDSAWIRVIDNGVGVPEELARRIFEPFFTTKKAGEGTGLGLCISKEIIQKHGGDLVLEDGAPGRGATFLVRVPLASA